MKILVIGGTGFFGIPMIEKLLSDGHEITVATRGNIQNPFRAATGQLIMDRSDYDSAKKGLKGKEFEVIIDKVAHCSKDVRNVLENVRCKKYIQMSSCSVYPEDGENIKEEAFDPSGYSLVWMDQNRDYAEGKRQAERAALEYLNASQCIFVRYPVVMGSKDPTGRLSFYVNHVSEEKAMYVDDLDFSMSFIQEGEAGRFIAHLVTASVSGAINGSSVGMISPREIIEDIEKITGKRALLEPDGDNAPYNGATANISYDLSKAEATGFCFSEIKDWISTLMRRENLEKKKDEPVPTKKREITISKNTKEQKLRQAPDEVLAMAIRDMMRKDKK